MNSMALNNKPVLKTTIIILMSAMLIIFAALQFNDPDPLFWITVYLFPAVVLGISTILSLKLNRLLMLISICIYGTGFSLFTGFNYSILLDENNQEYIEVIREAGGLLIILAALLFGYRLKAHKADNNS